MGILSYIIAIFAFGEKRPSVNFGKAITEIDVNRQSSLTEVSVFFLPKHKEINIRKNNYLWR